jgi:hypothetical protein
MENIPEGWLCGFFYGVLVAGILGRIFQEIHAANMRRGDMHRPLDTFPDANQPRLTAFGITRTSCFGYFGCLFWIVVFIFIAYVLYRISPVVMDLSF